jgi:hypothetical protein
VCGKKCFKRNVKAKISGETSEPDGEISVNYEEMHEESGKIDLSREYH